MRGTLIPLVFVTLHVSLPVGAHWAQHCTFIVTFPAVSWF